MAGVEVATLAQLTAQGYQPKGQDAARPQTPNEAEAATREDLAAAYQAVHSLGLNEGLCNHLTALVPGTTDRFLVIRYGLMWCEVTPENLVLVDATGRILSGEGPVEITAFEIHRAIHLTDPHKYACVLHTHMPYATALCCTKRRSGVWGGLSMCHQSALRFHEEIAYDDQFNGLVHERAEGERLAAVMQGKRVMFHRSHGVIVCGPSVAEAFDDLYYLERAAQVQVLAMSTGDELYEVDEGVCSSTKAVFDSEKPMGGRLHLDAWKRKLARSEAAAGPRGN